LSGALTGDPEALEVRLELVERYVGLDGHLAQVHCHCLDAQWFPSLQVGCEKLEAWRRHYNDERPNSAIGNIPPITLANSAGETSPPDLSKAENSRPKWSEVG
jgi:putative transposase